MDSYNLGNGVVNSCLLPVVESSQMVISIDSIFLVTDLKVAKSLV